MPFLVYLSLRFTRPIDSGHMLFPTYNFKLSEELSSYNLSHLYLYTVIIVVRQLRCKERYTVHYDIASLLQPAPCTMHINLPTPILNLRIYNSQITITIIISSSSSLSAESPLLEQGFASFIRKTR